MFHAFFHATDVVVVHTMSNVGVVKCVNDSHLNGFTTPSTGRGEVVRTERTIGEEVEVTAHDSTP